MPQRYILLADDFGNRRILALPLASRQLPVVSAPVRKRRTVLPLSGVTPDPCPKIRPSKHPAAAGFFLSRASLTFRNRGHTYAQK
jgi:hypothetical protein